jgi:hypothetical protein
MRSNLNIASIGIWSPLFTSWPAFCDGINDGTWQSETRLQPGLIAPRERRRAPQSVKMAVEVLGQACQKPGLDPATAAVVFSSSMGDMQITDYLCKVLAAPPRLVSPTRFHNSVHNATTGYWSIASQTHAPTNAISALAYSASMAFLEAAIQATEEDIPVLLVCQEMAAPATLHHACPSNQPISMAILLTRPGVYENPMASIQFDVCQKNVDWPALHPELNNSFDGNFGATLLPLLTAIAVSGFVKTKTPSVFEFPLSKSTCLGISLTAGDEDNTSNE